MCTLRACGNLCLSNVTDRQKNIAIFSTLGTLATDFYKNCSAGVTTISLSILRPEKSGLQKIPCILAEIKTNCPQRGCVHAEKRKRKEDKNLILTLWKKLPSMLVYPASRRISYLCVKGVYQKDIHFQAR